MPSSPEIHRERERNRARANPEANRTKAATWYAANKDRAWATHLKRRYGVSPEQYASLLAAQDGVCAICRVVCALGRRLAVDHDHATGKVRGLLCAGCNTGLGKFKDDPNLLRGALEYLRVAA